MGAVVRNLDGDAFRVSGLDLDRAKILTRADHSEEVLWTRPVLDHQIRVLKVSPMDAKLLPWSGEITYLALEISEQVTAYARIEDDWRDGDLSIIEIPETDQFPAIGFETRGTLFTIPTGHPLGRALDGEDADETLVQAMRRTACLFVRVHRREIEILFARNEDHWECLFYDRVDGGMGWSWSLAKHLADWLGAAAKLLEGCRCALEGCPMCAITAMQGEARRALIDCLSPKGDTD